ncbi:MAG: HD domain-containing protein [Chitinophagaceae bacterium]|nr:MAG: HD domain-containing protein [Chitinophagaceae bacterium]
MQHRKFKMDHVLHYAERYAINLFSSHPHPELIYHDLEHTRTVVSRVLEIGTHEMLNDADQLIVSIAAWFHDTGHLVSSGRGHEEKSVELFVQFLHDEYSLHTDLQTAVIQCILATKMPTSPSDLRQMVIWDADTYHLGTSDFLRTDDNVRKEFELRENMPAEDWDINSLRFLEQHRFYTGCCQQKFDPGKQKNIYLLRTKIQQEKLKS